MTTTVNYSWALPTVGASVNTWGTLVNNILTDIDAKMFPRTGGLISGNSSVTGTLGVSGTANAANYYLNGGAGTVGYNTSNGHQYFSNSIVGLIGATAITTTSSTGLSVTGLATITGGSDVQTSLTIAEPGTRSLVLRNPTSTLDAIVETGTSHPLAIGATGSFKINIGSVGARTTAMTIDASGNLMVMGRMLSLGDAGAINVAAGGTIALNIESISGLGTAGLLIVRGNENDLNQSIALYTYNLSFTGTSRYCRITQVQRNTLNNTYGDVYAYLSNYAGSYTTTDQTFSSSSTSMSDIYFRNVAAAPCNANFSIIRLV